MYILHVDDDPMMRDLVALIIHKSFGIQIRQAGSGQEAMTRLKLGEEYDLIISDFNMPNGTGGDLFEYLGKMQIHTPFILMSSDHPSEHPQFENHHIDGYIIKPNVATPLKSLMKLILHVEESKKEFLSDKFLTVNAKTLETIGEVPFDVYLRLGTNKHVRILKKGNVFSTPFAEKYYKKGVREFLIKSMDSDVLLLYLVNSLEVLHELKDSAHVLDDIHRILDKVTDVELKAQLNKVSEALKNLENSALSPSEALLISEATQRSAQRAIKMLGASLEVQTLVKASVKLTLETLSQIPELKGPLTKLMHDKEKYLSSHTIVLAQIASLIAHNLGWTSHLTKYKLSLAAFLHDITLSNHDLAKVSSLAELEAKRANFTNAEALEFKEHPLMSSALIKDFQQIPPDVHLIVEQHHEQPDGEGFPHGLVSSKIAPLSALFIVAHDLTSFMMEQSSHINVVEKFIQLRQKKYSHGQFKKILHSLETLTRPQSSPALPLKKSA